MAAPDVETFHYELRVDVPLTISLGLIDGMMLAFPMGAYRAPELPREPLPFFDVGAVAALQGRSSSAVTTADTVSDGLMIGALALPAAWGAVGSLVDAPRPALTTAGLAYEAIAVNGFLNQLEKGAAGRPRPYVYAFGDNTAQLERFVDVEDGLVQPDAYASFYSVHTSTVAAGTFAIAHMVAWSEPHPRWPRVVIPYTLAAAATATMGALRVEAGQHFPSDVVVGGVVGAAIGVAIPELHRLPVRVGADGTGVSVSGTW